jgi:hypothetical protein
MGYNQDLLLLKLHIFTICNKNCVSLEVMNYVLSFELLLLYYISKDNLREALKFGYLQSTYILAVKYMNSKPESH